LSSVVLLVEPVGAVVPVELEAVVVGGGTGWRMLTIFSQGI